MTALKVDFIDVAGEVTHLDDRASGCVVTGPVLDAYAPPVELTSAAVFDVDGELLRRVKWTPRTLGVPFAAIAADQDSLRNVIRTLTAKLNPKRGDGRLRFTHPDGSQRDLIVRYSQGLDLPILHDDPGEVWQEGELDFIAFDPLFTDSVDTTETFTTSGAKQWFSPAKWFGPAGDGVSGFFSFGGSTVFGDLHIANVGDDLAYPVFTVKGPGTDLVLTNLTTGKVIDLTSGAGLTLTNTQTLIIDTRPVIGGTLTIVNGDGSTSNAFPLLTPTSALWPLVTGDNHITVSMPSADATSRITVAYRLRYLTV
jgi:hypothetical protein